MSSQSERDPAEGITGIETFGLWLVGYRSVLLETAPRKYLTVPGSAHEDHPEELDPSVFLNLRNNPWADIPLSLQAVLRHQYPSAEADVEKSVDVVISDHDITFELISPLVVRRVDVYGEFKTHPGLILVTRFLNLFDDPKEVGKWKFHKRPASPEARIEGILRRDPRHKPELIPATTNELQDLARFLEKSKDRAKVTEIQFFPTE